MSISTPTDELPEVALPSAASHVLKITQAIRTTDSHELLVEVIKRELHSYAITCVLATVHQGKVTEEFLIEASAWLNTNSSLP